MDLPTLHTKKSEGHTHICLPSSAIAYKVKWMSDTRPTRTGQKDPSSNSTEQTQA